MPKQIYVKYHKWEKKEMIELFKTCTQHLDIDHCQLYIPIFALFFYIHNTKLSHKIVDFKRRFYIKKITDIVKQKYYNSNIILKGILYDSIKNINKSTEIFCKTISILDPMHCINNNYNKIISRNQYLPSLYNYNTFHKINSMDNTAYIDIFCSYIVGELVTQGLSPSFPIFYGCINGEKDYKYDITEDYYDLRVDKCFNKNIGKGFTIDIYLSDSDEDDTNDNESDSSNSSNSSNSTNSKYYEDDYIANIKKVPVQLLLIENLDATLEDLIHDEGFTQELLISGYFQITFALLYMQKNYQFTHNDLHINNIMYASTEKKFLYYKINNIYFRVPTYGKIFKIIDFGRAIFTFKNKTYMNDVFSDQGEAGGQYYYPSQVSFMNKRCKQKVSPNYNFDLCRLSTTVLDEIQNLDKNPLDDKALQFIISMCLDKEGTNFCECEDDFNLYINIAKNACHADPKDIINHSIFKNYRIKKKQFPKKSYYTL